MNTIEEHSLWRCRQCKQAIYEVLFVKNNIVHYRLFHHDNDAVFTMSSQLFRLCFIALSIDEALAVTLEAGGIY